MPTRAIASCASLVLLLQLVGALPAASGQPSPSPSQPQVTESATEDLASLIDQGRTLYRQGKLTEAVAPLTRAMELARALPTQPNSELASAAFWLATAKHDLWDFAEAERLADESLTIRRSLHAGEHADIAASMNLLAVVRTSLERATEAEPMAREALAMRQRLFNGAHLDVAESLNDLGIVLSSVQKNEEALQLYQQALNMRQRLLAEESPEVAESIFNVGSALYALDRNEEALAKVEEALAMERRLFAGDHLDVAHSLSGMALCLSALRRHAEALPKYEEALAMRQRLFKGDHVEVAVALDNVGVCLRNLGRHSEALPKHEEALAMRQRLLGDEHVEVAKSMNRAADCLYALGRASDAEGLIDKSIAIHLHHDKTNFAMAVALQSAARIKRALGKREETSGLLQQAIDLLEGIPETRNSEDHASALRSMAEVLSLQGRYRDSQKAYFKLFELRKANIDSLSKSMPHDIQAMIRALTMAADAAYGASLITDAIELQLEAIRLHRGVDGARKSVEAQLLSRLAQFYSADKKFDDSTDCYSRSLDILRSLGDQDHPDIAKAMRLLGLALSRSEKDRDRGIDIDAAGVDMLVRLAGNDPSKFPVDDMLGVASALAYRGRHDEALSRMQRAHDAAVAAHGYQSWETVQSLSRQSAILETIGRRADAIVVKRQSIELLERLCDERSRRWEIALDYEVLGRMLYDVGRDAESIVAYRRALALYQSRGNLKGWVKLSATVANLLENQGRFRESRVIRERAVEISESSNEIRAMPEAHLNLSTLASQYLNLGHLERARTAYVKAIDWSRLEDQLGSRNWSKVRAAEYIEALLAMGDIAEARRQMNLVLATDSAIVLRGGPRDAFIDDVVLQALAKVCAAERAWPDAIDAAQRLIAIRELPENAWKKHRIASAYASVAVNQWAAGNVPEAVNAADKAGVIAESLTDNRVRIATEVLALAGSIDVRAGRTSVGVDRLESALRRGVSGRTRFLSLLAGPERGASIVGVRNLASIVTSVSTVGAGDKAASAALLGVTLTKGVLTEASRAERQALFELADADPAARSLLEEQAHLQGERAALASPLRHEPLTEGQVGRLGAVGERLTELDRLLRDTSPAYAERARLAEIDVKDVAGSLAPGQALVEYAVFRPLVPNPDAASQIKFIDADTEHYAAFVLRPDTSAPEGYTVVAVDLGERKAIDEAVAAFRAELEGQIAASRGVAITPGLMRTRERRLATTTEAIRTLAWDPLSKHLQGVTRVYVSADARLHEVPFEALPTGKDDQGRFTYLAESTEVVYQAGGRELARARLARPIEPSNTAVLLGDPLFSADQASRTQALAMLTGEPFTPSTPAAQPAQQAAADGGAGGVAALLAEPVLAEPALAERIATTLGGGGGECAITWQWAQLPGTGQFITTTSATLQGSMQVLPPLTGAAASKPALLATLERHPRPRVLQLATHGFFCTQAPATTTLRPAMGMMDMLTSRDEPVEPDPMLRSMLILAGADVKGEGSQDNGLLSASEVMALDLRGTEVVGLTACHSGQGELQAGEGVAGLRMAFAVAGARSVLQSLWEVPADQSLEQTEAFYDKWLKQNKTRYGAFRSAQLEALQKARASTGSGHPWLWAGFTFAGDPGDLPGRDDAAKSSEAR